MSAERLVVVAGAGPAGLTFAHELLEREGWRVVVVEPLEQVGGLSRTVRHAGNGLDIGGHRFFSKSDRVLEWWTRMLPLALPERGAGRLELRYQGRSRTVDASGLPTTAPDDERSFRLRPRRSRILYDGSLFDYPLSLSPGTLRRLGVRRLAAIAGSYAAARLSRRTPPRDLEEFFIQRFGRRLYETFFKSYTEKVWGLPCDRISAEWGAQRVRSLSMGAAAWSALRRALRLRGSGEASLTEKFLYPYRGPGQLWEEAARRVVSRDGEIRLRSLVCGVEYDGRAVRAVSIRDLATGRVERLACDAFVTTMPVKDLFAALSGPVPADARAAAAELRYRDFVAVGLLVDRLERQLPDNWIYVHDPRVRLGRIQLYNNWSDGMAADPGKTWLGLEYFCEEGDAFWRLPDERIAELAKSELALLGLLDPSRALDSRVVRAPKAYPAYWGGYERFDAVRRFADAVPNLYLVGRNGMHRYNNQDHSMLAAMAAAAHLCGESADKSALWSVNADAEYHESHSPEKEAGPSDPSMGRPLAETAAR